MWRQHKRVPGSVDSWHRLRRPGSYFVSKTKNINPNASKYSENWTNWELAFPIHGKPSHSWVSFQHLFQQFWFPMSGAICFSKFCPSAGATRLPGFVAQREKRKKDRKKKREREREFRVFSIFRIFRIPLVEKILFEPSPLYSKGENQKLEIS